MWVGGGGGGSAGAGQGPKRPRPPPPGSVCNGQLWSPGWLIDFPRRAQCTQIQARQMKVAACEAAGEE